MRISPLGIFGVHCPLSVVGEWASQDASLTHPNPVCLQANRLFTMAISHAIGTGCEAVELYQNIKQWSEDQVVDSVLMEAIQTAADVPPADYVHHQGWVVTAFHNALYQLCHAPNLEAGVVDTVMRGGDTDTNAAICGAILGAVYSLNAVPYQWVTKILHCRPKSGEASVFRPRPECFWPIDALELAEQLLSVK